MFEDFRALLSLFHAHNVRYLVVGGYAVSWYAQPRATKDLDVWVARDAANADALYAALAAFGAPLADLSPSDLVGPGHFYRMGAPPQMVDLLPELVGVAFEEAWPRRVAVAIDPQGTTAWFIGRDDLIAAKLAAGRPEDLGDVARLRAPGEGPC